MKYGQNSCYRLRKKRTGLAWTDINQIIASPLETVGTERLAEYLSDLFAKEDIEKILLGFPTRLDGSDTHITQEVRELEKELSTAYPHIPVQKWDERFSSKLAMRALIDSGMKKKKRREKGQLDKMSAVIMLQEYLGNNV